MKSAGPAVALPAVNDVAWPSQKGEGLVVLSSLKHHSPAEVDSEIQTEWRAPFGVLDGEDKISDINYEIV